MDIDPYPWIIWYCWKKKNDKLFRANDRDPLEVIRYAKGECQAWFTANELTTDLQNPVATSQILCLESICLIDGSLAST